MLRAVRDAKARHGRDSHTHAAAQNALGTVLLNAGQLDRAVDAFRAAVAGPEPQEEPARRDRLTYLANLGVALMHGDKLDEAEQVLRQGLDGRRQFYGRDHAGYAFGLEPLADVLLQQGKAGAALEVIEQAVAVFMQDGHPRIASALALRAEALTATGSDIPPFEGLDDLPDNLIEQLGDSVIGRMGQTDPQLLRPVLADLVPLVEGQLGEDHPLLLNVLATAANLERDLGEQGDASVRQQAIEKVIAVHDGQGRHEEALQAVLGLALAQSDAGRQEEALASYQDAVRRADALPQAGHQAQTRRNYGLFLADQGRRQDAERELRTALQRAAVAIDRELLGRCQVALGVFVQHGGQHEEARQRLGDAVKLLDPAHPDAVCARGHLSALESGGSCGCGDRGKALAEAFREFVMGRLPADLLAGLDVEPKDGRFEYTVHLKRKPTEEEMQRLDRVINHALGEFWRRALGEPAV